MKRLSKNTAQIAATVGILVVLIGVYVGGYFWFGKPGQVIVSSKQGDIVHHFRFYRYEIVATAYEPLAWIESIVTGQEVQTSQHPGQLL